MLTAPYGDIGYTVMIVLGLIAALFFVCLYLHKKKVSRNEIIDLLLVCIGTLLLGFIFAFLFQLIYDVIEKGSSYVFEFRMTFLGGLIGGVLAFILLYFLFYTKRHPNIFDKLLIIAPGSIAFAHGCGRIGCFLAGCCYGKATDSWIGIIFPALNDGIKRIPTQLIEAIFLLILGSVLLILAFQIDFKYTSIIYLGGYTIFRFIIEFYRGDDRGGVTAASLSPSQIVCVVLFVLSIPLFFVIRRFVFKVGQNVEN